MKHLIEDYYLGTDENNYILYKRSINKSGKNKGGESFKPLSYFGQNINAVLKRLIDLKVQKSIENEGYEQLLDFCEQVIALKEKIDERG